MSEWIYKIIDFPKYHRKNLIDFCPRRFYRLGTCDLFWLVSRGLRWVHNIPSLNKLARQKSIKYFRWYFGKLFLRWIRNVTNSFQPFTFSLWSSDFSRNWREYLINWRQFTAEDGSFPVLANFILDIR